MKLGFVTAILPDLSLEEVLKFAAQEGFECVEVMCWPMGKAERRYAGVTHIDVNGFGDAEARKVKALTKKHGVEHIRIGILPEPIVRGPERGGGVRGAHQKNDHGGAEAWLEEREHFCRA